MSSFKSNDLFVTMQKIVFIYNALLTGWTVSMVDKDKFEFTKGIMDKKEVNFDNYLKKFIEYNANIENIK